MNSLQCYQSKPIFSCFESGKLVPAERCRLGTTSIPKSSTLPSARAVHFVNVARVQAILGSFADVTPEVLPTQRASISGQN